MNDANDSIGDLLREFYAAFGTKDEGPPAGVNLTAALGKDAIPSEDAGLLRYALDDTTLRRQFRTCREIIEDLATRLTTEELLCELSCNVHPSEREFEQLSSGIFWFTLASLLDQREKGIPKNPFEEKLHLPLSLKVRLTVQGSLVFRLYIALVYMQEGILRKLIEEGAKARHPCCGRVVKLLNSDYVRRVRNALAHGSFSATVAGIAFHDEHGHIVATPGFLNWLCTWITLIQLQARAACGR